jgi:hypothetical protein
MTQYICKKCFRVFECGDGKCCGETEPFDLQKHGPTLISLSNAWVAVSKEWEGDRLLEAVRDELIKDGCYSAAIIFNEFIKRLEQKIACFTYQAGPSIGRPEDMVEMKAEITSNSGPAYRKRTS